MGSSGDQKHKIKVIWFDEQINQKENQNYFKQLKSTFKRSESYRLLDEGFDNFYKNNNENDFKIIIVIVSGRLFGRYIKEINDNINEIINIPYTYIFTSPNYKNVLLKLMPDKEHNLSYNTKIEINSRFYNPGGVYDDFDNLLNKMKILSEKIVSSIRIKQRDKDKINYEGIFTFEYLSNEEDILAPSLYKDIITNEKITYEACNIFHKFLLSYNEEELNTLIKNLELFRYIPFEILSKYWARFYTIESDFYKVLNNQLMKSILPFNYKTFIKMLYTGVEINSLKSFQGIYLFRGSSINKIELKKIKNYKKKGKLSNIVVFSKAFLSFSEDKDKAESFCGISDDTKIGCLYILENNNNNLHESNADIQNISYFPGEKEILFFPGSSFIIKNIEDIKYNKIEIKLNYHGKFKEKYSFIYNDKKKINKLICENELTRNISGKELIFLKNGKYLKGEEIGIGGKSLIYKAKDLKTDEIVVIKQIKKKGKIKEQSKIREYIKKECDLYKQMSEKTKYSCKFKDLFETKDDFNIVLSYYDDSLYNFFLKNDKFPPNLIKKIFKQLNEAFKELLNNNIIHRNINPSSILIKYNNTEKTNFDSVLSGYGNKQYGKTYLCNITFNETEYFMAPEIAMKKPYNNKCDLYSIGLTIFFLYFGNFPYYFSDRIEKGKNIPKIEEDGELEDLLEKLLK